MQRVLFVLIIALVALIGVRHLRHGPPPARPSAAAATASTAAPGAAPATAEASAAVELLTANQLAALVRRYPPPTGLVLYGTADLLSRQLMPGLEQIATRHRADGLLVHAVNTDPDSAGYDIPRFMRSTGASFPALRLADRDPGDLGRALVSAGSEVITGNSAYTLPVVVVWDRAGTVVAQAQGMADTVELERVVSGVLARSR
jgi:hypothetical protein